MDYRKMSGREIMNEYELAGKMLEDDARRGCWIRDGVRKETDRRDAMLAAAGKMAEAMEQTVRPCERCGLISVADQVRSSLSAYRAAEGGEA